MKQSNLLTKTKKTISEQETSINAQLLERAGYVSKLMSGVYSFLPLGLRVLNNIETIVKEEMNAAGGQELLLPALQPKDNWLTTDRWDNVDILFKLKGAGDRDLCLGPTHEEIITPLVGEYLRSYKDLPKYVYQIQTKFRNEPRAKSGLLRGREFRMKDLYSFHISQDDLNSYYERMRTTYMNVFRRCGLGDTTYFTYASGGMFSKYSHEFQTITPYGEDTIFVCEPCKVAINHEIIAEQSTCPECNNSNLVEKKSIEVGNIFKLQTRFSDAFKLSVTNQEGKQQPVLMGCYGIGTSRLMGAIVELSHDERGIIWPHEIAPYNVHLVSLVKNPDEVTVANKLYEDLQQQGISVLYDDRIGVQPGEKFAESDLLGMPVRLVISSKTLAQQSVEVKYRNKTEAQLVALNTIIKQLLQS